MTTQDKYRIRESIALLELTLRWLSPTDLYAHTQITEALAALRMLDVGEGPIAQPPTSG